jgi:molecular chaperone DnaK (HSP70)
VGLGIDFGTTRTVVAYADRGNYPVVSFEGAQGDAVEWFPSVVAERAGELRFGFDALAVADDASFSQVRSFKRLLGGRDVTSSGMVTVGTTRLSVAELVLRFIAAFGDALRTRSNLPKNLRAKAELAAVVATPANAFCTQRFVTLEAFRRAGFSVRALLNEPSAAGFEYSHRHARTLTSKREHVIVYDLGGGTFDASLVRMSGTHHDVVMTAGLAALGGDDFDRALADLAARQGKLDLGALSPHRLARLLDGCRDAKEALNSSSRKITLDLESCLGDAAPTRELTLAVSDYYDACAPLVESTMAVLRAVIEREGAPEGGGGDDPLSADVAGLYVVGGASALPVVGRVLRTRFGRRVHRSPYPHASVCIGLAIASDADAGFELEDRFSRNFGVFREAQGGDKASYDAIFTREMALPRPGDPPITVRRRYRAAHDVGHYRFFECAAFDGEGNPRGDIAPLTELLFPFDAKLRNGGIDLAGVPVRRLDRDGPVVEESYAVDAHGMVEVTITDLDSGFARTHLLGAPA